MKIKKLDLLPLKAVVLYVTIGVLLSFYGPMVYSDYEKLPVFAYMLSFVALFMMGYIGGLYKVVRIPKSQSFNTEVNKHKTVLFFVKFCIVLIVIVQCASIVVSIYDGSLNLSVSKLGQSYLDAYKDYERGTGNVSTMFLVQTLTYVPYLVTLILGTFYFKCLTVRYKFLLVFVFISILILETLSHGKQKQIGDMIIFIALAFLLNSNIQNREVRKKVYKRLMSLFLLGLILLVFVLHFRYFALGIDASNINSKIHHLITVDTDSLLFKAFPEDIAFPLSMFSSYLSQGYYGLSLCMKEPFEWTYLIGNSYSITVFLERFLDVNVDFHDTYPYRASLNSGWDDTKWSTVFTWFAGDLTFIGTLFLFSGIAYLYAVTWKESFYYGNPISILLFNLLTIGLLYIPANNQILHTPGSVLALFSFIVLWALKRERFNFVYLTTEKNLKSN